MPSQARSFEGHADLVAAAYPWLVPPPLLGRGMFLGFELGTGRPCFMDIQWLKRVGILSSTDVRLVGLKEAGKTTLAKCILHGSMGLQAGLEELPVDATPEQVLEAMRFVRGRANDRDMEGKAGEYDKLCEELVGRTVTLAEEGSIDLFDLRMGSTELDLVRAGADAFSDVKGSRLDVFESLAQQVAISKLMQGLAPVRLDLFESTVGGITTDDVTTYKTANNNVLREELKSLYEDLELDDVMRAGLEQSLSEILERPSNITEDPHLEQELRAASTRVEGYAGELLRGGQYGGMFGSKNSPYDLLTNDFTVLDWNGVPSRAADLLNRQIMRWTNIGLRLGDTTVTPDYVTNDEEGSEISNEDYAQARAELTRKSRKRRTVDLSMQQYVTDALTVGTANSDLRHWGEVIHRSAAMWLLGGQPDEEPIRQTIAQLGVGEPDIDQAIGNPQGCWTVVVPKTRSVQHFQHVVLPSQEGFIASAKEAAKAGERVRSTTIEEVVRRIEQIGSITIGVPS